MTAHRLNDAAGQSVTRPDFVKEVCATNSQASGLIAWPMQRIQAMYVCRDVAVFQDVVVLRAVGIILSEIPSNTNETMSGSIKFCTGRVIKRVGTGRTGVHQMATGEAGQVETRELNQVAMAE